MRCWFSSVQVWLKISIFFSLPKLFFFLFCNCSFHNDVDDDNVNDNNNDNDDDNDDDDYDAYECKYNFEM